MKLWEQYEDDLMLQCLERACAGTNRDEWEVLDRITILHDAKTAARIERQAKLDSLFALEEDEKKAIAEAEKVAKEAEERAKAEHLEQLTKIEAQELERQKMLKQNLEEKFKKEFKETIERISRAEDRIEEIIKMKNIIIGGEI